MSVLDLDAYVTRSRALVDATPPSTRRETRTWLVDPLLETLGWDVHADSCLTDPIIDGTRLEYVCSVDGVPALLVAVDPFGDSLEKSRAVALLETMAWTGIDRAIYTDGRDYLLLAGTTDVERLACRLTSLSDHESAIAHYTRDAVGRSLERHSREFVARQLAIERPNLAEAIVDELTDATEQGDAYASEFESATDRFLEQLVASFADGGSGGAVAELESAGSDDISVEFSDPSASGGETDGSSGERSTSLGEGYIQRERTEESTTVDESGGSQSDGRDSSAADASESDSVADAGASTEPDAVDSDAAQPSDDTDGGTDSEGDGEYVVRFFNDRGSVGAIGHASADQALVATAEYLFERGLSGVTVPWHPDDDEDDHAVLHESPTHPDGTPMSEPQQLSNGLYLETAGDTDERAARVDALVARAGLRAMLTGDWEE
ncbi:hypothetical protein [Natronorubrum sp. DTA28]|uniref:hypothetical protein n=1 Tax=Natronorubrum sp. DTA28 TaxID=3447019 RepID=UPI003F8621E4